jgi:hypothetical protein
MFSRFFIDRPIFAAVLSIVIVLAGLVARQLELLAGVGRGIVQARDLARHLVLVERDTVDVGHPGF